MGLNSINVARIVYLLVFELAGVLIALSTRGNEDFQISIAAGLVGGLVVALFGIFVETLMKGFTLRGFSTATFGILVGLLCAWLLTRVGIDDLIAQGFSLDQDRSDVVQLIANVVIFGSLAFFGAALALRSSREDFAFIIPYVRFRSESLGGRPVLLDAEAVMDGRVVGLATTGFLPTTMVVPDFVLEHFRTLSEDPSPHAKREGKAGLEALAQLKALPGLELRIHDTRSMGLASTNEIDSLVTVAQVIGGRLLTVSSELAQVARVQSVDVLDLSALIDALRPKVAVGEVIRLPLVRAGKEDQAIGYLPDGRMIVVNRAISAVGQTRDVRIINTHETNSGLMIFGELTNG